MNPEYESTFVFDNDFPALEPDAPEPGKAMPQCPETPRDGACPPLFPRPEQTLAEGLGSSLGALVGQCSVQPNRLSALEGPGLGWLGLGVRGTSRVLGGCGCGSGVRGAKAG